MENGNITNFFVWFWNSFTSIFNFTLTKLNQIEIFNATLLEIIITIIIVNIFIGIVIMSVNNTGNRIANYSMPKKKERKK